MTTYLLSVGLFAHKLGYMVNQDNRIYKGAVFVGLGAIPAICILRMLTMLHIQTKNISKAKVNMAV